jgi:hypothetical protein
VPGKTKPASVCLNVPDSLKLSFPSLRYLRCSSSTQQAVLCYLLGGVRSSHKDLKRPMTDDGMEKAEPSGASDGSTVIAIRHPRSLEQEGMGL